MARPDYQFKKIEDELMVALGRLTYNASYLDAILSVMLMRLVSHEEEIGRRLTADAQSQWLINQVRALAHLRFPSGEVREEFDDWLGEVEEARAERNRVIHSTWYFYIDPASKPNLPHGLQRTTVRGKTFKQTAAPISADDLHRIAYRLEQAGLVGVYLMGPVRALMGELVRAEQAPT